MEVGLRTRFDSCGVYFGYVGLYSLYYRRRRVSVGVNIIREVYLFLYIVNSTVGSVGVGFVVGFIYFLNVAINFVFYLNYKKGVRFLKVLFFDIS